MKLTKDQSKVVVDKYSKVVAWDYDARTAFVKDLAKDFDTTVPTVRGILVAAKVYIAKPANAAKAADGRNKEDVVAAIEAVVGVKLPSFKNASKKDLLAFWDRFVALGEITNLNS